MFKYIAVLVVLAVAANAQICSSPKEVDNLQNCDWYSKSTCCDSDSTGMINAAIKEIEKDCDISQGCKDYITLALCAQCSPTIDDEGDWCKKFCEKYSKACEDQTCEYDEDSVNTKSAEYDINCEQFPEDECFNAASVTSGSAAAVVAAAFVAALAM